MRLKRLTISLFFILLFYFSFHYLDSISTNDTTVSYINSDNEDPLLVVYLLIDVNNLS